MEYLGLILIILFVGVLVSTISVDNSVNRAVLIIIALICLIGALELSKHQRNSKTEVHVTNVNSTQNDSIYTINNMKYIIINGNVINLTKDSLECKFYKDEENF